MKQHDAEPLMEKTNALQYGQRETFWIVELRPGEFYVRDIGVTKARTMAPLNAAKDSGARMRHFVATKCQNWPEARVLRVVVHYTLGVAEPEESDHAP